MKKNRKATTREVLNGLTPPADHSSRYLIRPTSTSRKVQNNNIRKHCAYWNCFLIWIWWFIVKAFLGCVLKPNLFVEKIVKMFLKVVFTFSTLSLTIVLLLQLQMSPFYGVFQGFRSSFCSKNQLLYEQNFFRWNLEEVKLCCPCSPRHLRIAYCRYKMGLYYVGSLFPIQNL